MPEIGSFCYDIGRRSRASPRWQGGHEVIAVWAGNIHSVTAWDSPRTIAGSSHSSCRFVTTWDELSSARDQLAPKISNLSSESLVSTKRLTMLYRYKIDKRAVHEHSELSHRSAKPGHPAAKKNRAEMRTHRCDSAIVGCGGSGCLVRQSCAESPVSARNYLRSLLMSHCSGALI